MHAFAVDLQQMIFKAQLDGLFVQIAFDHRADEGVKSLMLNDGLLSKDCGPWQLCASEADIVVAPPSRRLCGRRDRLD